jgi:regulator of protease activity HflC (stomatin/prohibitin superfamily)
MIKSAIRFTIGAILALALLYGVVWKWGFCRFYVEPNEMAIIIAKSGEPMPPGQILADRGQKGIQRRVLGEGRHFLNPILYTHEIRNVTIIDPGKVGVVTSKVGDDLPEGEFLADTGQKGIWKTLLGPGKYRMNPYGYQIDVVNAISIPIGYAGVITSLSGEQALPGQFATANQKGVRRDILQPGLYYVNPKQYKVDVLEIGVNQVSLLGKTGGEVVTKTRQITANAAMQKQEQSLFAAQRARRDKYISGSSSLRRDAPAKQQQRLVSQQEEVDVQRAGKYVMGDSMNTLGLAEFVEFPSRDGFNISLDMSVEVELHPSKIAGIFSNYGDLPAVVDKIIMPQITSISRNKGSEYRAKDFIVGEGREKFQNDLTDALAAVFEAKDLIVHNALIRHVEVPQQILDPIQQTSIAVEQDLTNKERQNTARKQAELNTEITLIEQRRRQVEQETRKLVAEIKADQEKTVAEIQAETKRKAAEIAAKTADIVAKTTRLLGTAKADALKMVEGAKADGFQLKATAFQDPTAFIYWEMARNLNPDVEINILHAGDGTLWTDLKNATLGDLGGAKVIKK